MLESSNPKIEELAKDAKSIESDGAKFMDPGSKRRGRGRPAGSKKTDPGPQPQPEPQMQGPATVEIVRPMMHLVSGWVPRIVQDERAAMKPEELEAITVCTAALFDKYALTLGKYAVEIAFLGTMGAYVLRVYAIHETNKQDRAKREREPFGKSQPDRTTTGTGTGFDRPQTRQSEFPAPVI